MAQESMATYKFSWVQSEYASSSKKGFPSKLIELKIYLVSKKNQESMATYKFSWVESEYASSSNKSFPSKFIEIFTWQDIHCF